MSSKLLLEWIGQRSCLLMYASRCWCVTFIDSNLLGNHFLFLSHSPFGLDKVDIPMEAFCATVEAQVNAIDERAKDGTILKFATG